MTDMHKYIAKESTGEVFRVERLNTNQSVVKAVAQGLHQSNPQEFSLVVGGQRHMAVLVPVSIVSHTLIGAPDDCMDVVLLDEAGSPTTAEFDFMELAL